MRKRGFFLVWLFDICELQFGIVREVCYRTVFGSVVWRFALSWFVATFGFDLWLSLWFEHNWYLVFVFGICEPLVLWFVFVRESYLGVFGIWISESVSTLICIIPNLL